MQKHGILTLILFIQSQSCQGWVAHPWKLHCMSTNTVAFHKQTCQDYRLTALSSSSSSSSSMTTKEEDPEDSERIQALLAQWEPEKLNQVGNLCADDEWMGLSMELTELVRVAVIEEVKKNARDFLGKDNYKVCFIHFFYLFYVSVWKSIEVS